MIARGGCAIIPRPIAGGHAAARIDVDFTHRRNDMGRLTQGKSWIVLSAAAVAVSFFGLSRGTAARAAADDAAGVKFFEEKVRPILAQNCVGCHGPEKQKGGLRMDTRENLIKGGKDEDKVIKVVEPGDPAKSMIVEAIEYKNEDIQMPPPKKNVDQKLSDDKIAILKEWVKMGVPYGEKPIEAPPKAEK
jgi:mono/diheme cytochrome c family protein